ncbi:MAG TPA: hypothetical protein VMK32_08675 [Burkholderiaceae bacterium]|nr:hypothetical protein [Burkholderiaceae bacterium]
MHARVVVATDGVQRHVDAWLAEHPAGARAILVEGLGAALDAPAAIPIARIPAGCVCCLGRTPLRVALVRTVRATRPEHLLLLLTSGEHVDRVRTMLADGSLGVRFDLE